MRSSDFNFLLENVSKKMASWKTNLLNMAGRVCLANSVMASIPSYMMQVFWIPRNILYKMNQAMRGFVWARGGGTRGWHRASWATLTLPKKQGGLGLKEMTTSNTALMGKAAWAMLAQPEKLWVRIMHQKYLNNASFLRVKAKPTDSPIWRGILKARDQLHEGFRYKLGNGSSSFWYSDWSGRGKLADQVWYVNIADTDIQLANLIVNGNWNFDQLYTEIPPQFKESLAKIKPQLHMNKRDTWSWWQGSKGYYTVKEAYAWLNNRNRDGLSLDGDWRWIWKLNCPEKIRMFIWQVIQDVIPTNRKRFRCNLSPTPACPRCSCPEEDTLHCLRECAHAKELWLRMGAWSWPGFTATDVVIWVRRMASSPHCSKFLAGAWGNWKWRNSMIFDTEPWTMETAWRKVCHDHDEFASCLNTHKDYMEIRMIKSWEPPGAGWIKLNSDGSYRENGDVMGCGGLLRDNKGNWLQGVIRHEVGGNPLLAEALALLEGLRLAWNGGFRQVLAEVDSEELLAAIDDEVAGNYVMEFSDIRELIKRNWQMHLRRVPRDCNTAADHMAKLAAAEANLRIRVLNAPYAELEPIILRDRLRIS